MAGGWVRGTGLSGALLAALSGAALAGGMAGGSPPAPRVVSAAPRASAAPPSAAENEFFESKVRPVLAERCFTCHGPRLQQGGLRLDSRAALLKGSSSGQPVLVPGRPEKSALIRVLQYTGAVKMPPSGKLSVAELETLTRWVKLGAPWPGAAPEPQPGAGSPGAGTAWAFTPVKPVAIPPVKNRAWPRSPIDAFILAGLERRGLAPARAADRRTLIRRASFDLTGLPPAPAEVEAFVSDTAPGAWAKVVDRLLASPRYGERWARHWLDLARYCDSFDARLLGDQNAGREMDVADAWRYRDWVVRAFNMDLPYDQFVQQQIAGDLLPAPGGGLNADGVVATGFLALGNWGGGDADKHKLLTDIADDQVDTVSRAFMGLTVGCARCHDHKFDPISTRDYYGLAGIFFSTHILANVGPKTNGPPMLRIPILSPADQAAKRAHAARLRQLESQLQNTRSLYYGQLAQSLAPQAARYMVAAWELGRGRESLQGFAKERGLRPYALRQWLDYLGLSRGRLLTTPVKDANGARGVHVWRGAADCPNVLVNTGSQTAHILTFHVPPKGVTVHPGPRGGVILAWQSPISETVRVTGRVIDADPNGGDGIAWSIRRRSTGGTEELAGGSFRNGGEQDFALGQGGPSLRQVAMQSGDELQLLVLPKADYTCDTTLVQLQIAADGGRVWDVSSDLSADPLAGNPHADGFGNPGVWRFYDAEGVGPSSGDPALAEWRRAAASAEHAAVEQAASAYARGFGAADPAGPFFIHASADEAELPEDARTAIGKVAAMLEAARKEPDPPAQFANGAQEGGVPGSPQAGVHDVRVHIRGRYDRLGGLVPRHFPVVLAGEHQPPITRGSGRLELARWLARPEHPLTARVMVNRVWQHLFGQGIVRTPSNWGKLGERPTHPELVDYLAARFSAPATGAAARPEARTAAGLPGMGWSIKRLIREIMLSSAYQQSSIPSAAALRLDPDNRLFSRMNRKRLEAEAIRDNLLAVSGRLAADAGGPATREFGSPRRSLYLMTVRSDRSGFGPLFDVADSTNSVDRRSESTVAPQALFLWNGPFALEAAKQLAKRLLALGAADDAARIDAAYRLAYGRPAAPEEARVGREFLAAARGTAARAPNNAGGAEERAWMEYASVLLCANEFVYVD